MKRKTDQIEELQEITEPVEEVQPVEETLDERSKLSPADKVRWLAQRKIGGK